MVAAGHSLVTRGLEIAPTGAVERARELVPLLARTAAEHDRAGTFPFENFALLQEADLIALRTPREYGGGGAPLRDAAGVIGAIGQGEPATALVLAMQYIQHAAIARSTRWPAQVKAKLASDAIFSGALINALRVEPDLGSPARGGLPATMARREGNGWRLSGRKIYSTGAPILDWYTVWVRTDETTPRVGNVLVPARIAGVTIEETWDHLGLRASGSHDVVFDDVALPAEYAVDLRDPSEWTSGDLAEQHVENGILLASLYQGVGKAARAWIVEFLKSRTPSNLGKPLASLPRMQTALGEIEIRLRTNDRLIDSLSSEIDAGLPYDPLDAHALKSVVTNNVVEAIRTALDLAGNHGLTRANPLQRYYRDALCGRIHTPQDDSVKSMLGQRALA